MDGLPGLRRGLEAGKREKVVPLKKMVGPFAPTRYHYVQGFTKSHMLCVAILSVCNIFDMNHFQDQWLTNF